MKFFASLIAILLCFLVEANSQHLVDKFIDQQLKQDRAIAMTLPGWLIRKGGRIGYKYASDDDDAKEFYKISQHVKKLRFIVLEEQLTLTKAEVDKLLKNIQLDGFERYLNVRSENDHVHILVKEKEDIIQNLLVLVYEPETFVLINVKMKLPMEIFDQLEFDPKFEDH
jgi:hypothetical protein